MRMKAILTATVSTVMFLTSIGSFPAFADTVSIEEREAILAELTSEQQEVLKEYWEKTGSYDLPSVSIDSDSNTSSSDDDLSIWDICQGTLDKKPYVLPYSFEEFLAFSDEEFLALEDVPESVKEYYKRYCLNDGIGLVHVGLYPDITFGGSDYEFEVRKEEICEFFNIPSEIVHVFIYEDDYDILEEFYIVLKNEEYNGYPTWYISNKLAVYMEFHEAVCTSSISFPCWGSSEFALGDIDCDGEVGVTDVVLLQKWLLGSGELPNWQNADLHQDGIINIFDLVLLKRMLIEK
ncbi:MAG: dockerin type I repeat-containing protein [Oscillospiraceae bacterium]|nr:dockerin type I repeat-containing protein [Oscillospiraceae bacterium]